MWEYLYSTFTEDMKVFQNSPEQQATLFIFLIVMFSIMLISYLFVREANKDNPDKNWLGL